MYPQGNQFLVPIGVTVQKIRPLGPVWTNVELSRWTTITGTHAPRIGSATEAVKNLEISLLDIKHSGRWKNIKTPLTYLRQNPESLCKVSKTLGQMLLQEKKAQDSKKWLKIAVDQAIEEAVNYFYI